MDNQQMPPSRSSDGFSAGNNLFADNQHFSAPAYDTLFASGTESGFNETSNWAVNPNGYMNQPQSRASLQSWQQPPAVTAIRPSHLLQHHPHPSPSPLSQHNNNVTARSQSHSPAAFAHQNVAFNGYAPPTTNAFSYSQSPYDPALFSKPNGPPGREFDNSFPSFDARAPNGQQLASLQQQSSQSDQQSSNVAGISRDPKGLVSTVSTNQSSLLTATAPALDGQVVAAAIPKGDAAGLFTIINFDTLARETNSERLGNFLNVGKAAWDWPLNATALPPYVSRKSRNDLKKLAGSDTALLAKIARSASKSSGKVRGLGGVSKLGRPVGSLKTAGSVAESKVDLDSSSEEESSEDDNSSYTSDEDLENSPLATKRSANPKEAVEYDTIKSLWRSKRRPVDGPSIRKALADFWDTVKTIRDRWKADTAAVTDAEGKKEVSDLPLLQSRVKDSRDMIETAFKTALKHGHRSILELFSENLALMYLCYQFLLDRFKESDLNGALARTILEVLSMCTTLNGEKVGKTHLDKVIPRYIKKGDAKTQFYAKRINSNAAALSNDNALANPSESKDPKTSNPSSTSATKVEQALGAKRTAGTTIEGTPQKNVISSIPKSNATAGPTIKANGVMKKVVADPSKPVINVVTSTKPKTVVTKPSTFFSSLQSATKKPGTSIKAGTAVSALHGNKIPEKGTAGTASSTATAPKSTFSFAETMANLTKPKEQKTLAKPEEKDIIETAEEKAKRLRKEARRKLHVTFRPADELVEIRYFTHDPEEDYGHDSSQMRDVSDVGGEGRMLKEAQSRMTDYDDDDDNSQDEEPTLIDFFEPHPIDFSDVDAEELKRNYYKFGGTTQPDSPERTEREQYEAKTLIVFYADSSDIPPTPREPPESEDAGNAASITSFGLPEQAVLDKAQQRTAMRSQASENQPLAMKEATRSVAGYTNQFFPPSQMPMPASTVIPLATPQIPQAGVNIDLQAILANLTASLPTQSQSQAPMQPPAPAVPNFGSFANAPPNNMPASGANIDLGAILAQLNAGQPNNTVGNPPALAASHAPSFAQPMPGNFENPDRKRLREDDLDDNNAGASKRVHHLFRTKPCRFWLEGKCLKGDNCTYVHEGEPFER